MESFWSQTCNNSTQPSIHLAMSAPLSFSVSCLALAIQRIAGVVCATEVMGRPHSASLSSHVAL